MKRKFWRKKLMAMTVLMSLLLSATGCSEDPDAQTSSTKSSGSGDSWVIYWYLCGSDLESNAAAATTDLQEMLQVTLPENVKVVIRPVVLKMAKRPGQSGPSAAIRILRQYIGIERRSRPGQHG